MNINVLVCDDNPDDVISVVKHLHEYQQNNNIKFEIYAYTDTQKASVCNSKIDIAILDVEMPGQINGIELGRILKQQNNAHIILIYASNYKKYIDDAMDLGIIRFFDKPIIANRFYCGIEKAVQIIDESTVPLYLKNKDCVSSVQVKDIIMVEIVTRGTKIYTTDAVYLSTKNMKYWVESLNYSYFTSPHKSYIINMYYITDYKRNLLDIDGNYTVAISKRQQSEFRKKYFAFMEGR